MEGLTEYYDTKIKRFQDGTVQYSASRIFVPYNNFVLSPGIDKPKESDPVKVARDSYRRTINSLYDILHANVWDYFITLTFNSDYVDRYDYGCCTVCIIKFLDLLRHNGCLYVVVPERHKDGAWHFHGLINNADNLKLIVNSNGYLEIPSYHYGFNSISRVEDSAKASNYILKYMIKGYNFLDIPKGKKRYFASRGLDRPDIEYDVFTQDEIDDLISRSHYYKKIDNDFYDGYIIDVKEV